VRAGCSGYPARGCGQLAAGLSCRIFLGAGMSRAAAEAATSMIMAFRDHPN
jgi:hypothetical protein